MVKKIIFAIMLASVVIGIVKNRISEVNAKTPYIAFNMLLQTQVRVNNKNADYRTITEEEPFIDLADFEKYVVPKIYDGLE